MRKIIIGKTYRHFKGNLYKVIDIVNDSESTGKELKKVDIYEALYGEHLKWARSYDAFISKVDKDKYPDSNQIYRFEEID